MEFCATIFVSSIKKQIPSKLIEGTTRFGNGYEKVGVA
jgi:hypothetical protein